VCVLAVLQTAPLHGYALAQRLESAGLGTVKGGTLYPLLGRLEQDGSVTSAWLAGAGGPGRKVFSLSSAGADTLARLSTEWGAFVGAVANLLPPPCPSASPATASRTDDLTETS
jgi:PadR family transcriptional regulator PadR